MNRTLYHNAEKSLVYVRKSVELLNHVDHLVEREVKCTSAPTLADLLLQKALAATYLAAVKEGVMVL